MSSEEYLKAPKEQIYYRYLAKIITILGIGHQSWWGYEEKPHVLVVVLRFIITHIPFVPVTSLLIQVCRTWGNLPISAVSSTLTMTPIAFVVFIDVMAAQRKVYIYLIKQFLPKIHFYNFRNNDAQIDQILIKLERYIRLMTFFLIIISYISAVAWSIVPIQYNIKNIHQIHNRTKELQSILYFWLPFDYLYNVKTWTILHVINIFITALATGIIGFSKILNYILIFHLSGHISFFKYKIKMFNKSEQEDSKKLIDVIKYHIFIKRVFRDIQDSFGINVTTNYCHNLIGDSLLLYNVMFGDKENFLTFGFMAVLYMGDLVILSFVLEEIRRQTDDLADLVYSMPWQNMSIPNQKMFLVFFGRVQEPLEFISAGGLRAGVKPMISIAKSTFSYYVMLKTSINKEI